MNLFHSPNFTFTFRQQKHDPMPWWKTNSALDMNFTYRCESNNMVASAAKRMRKKDQKNAPGLAA